MARTPGELLPDLVELVPDLGGVGEALLAIAVEAARDQLFEALGSTHLSEIIDSLNRIHLQGTSATVVTVAGLAVLMVCVLAAILALTKGFAWALRRGTGG